MQHEVQFFISTGLKAILVQYEFTDLNTRNNLSWTIIGNGDPMHGVYTSRIGTARVEQEEKADTNNNKIVRNLEEMNVSTKEEESQRKPSKR